ncbi:MAG: phosphate acyltransferase, partial [Eubacteriales bacterium]|nr:phosphate acyltransferase [Eubacteriales bacterium]
MSKFLETIKERAKSDKKTIVLPESMDKRTFEAADQMVKEGRAQLMRVGARGGVAGG